MREKSTDRAGHLVITQLFWGHHLEGGLKKGKTREVDRNLQGEEIELQSMSG